VISHLSSIAHLCPYTTLFRSPNESVDFQGHTGPFIQYTHARIKSVLRKAEFNSDAAIAIPPNISSYERDLIQALGQFPSVIEIRSEEHTSELQSRENLVCRLL